MTSIVRLDLTCQRKRTFRFQILLDAAIPPLDEDWAARMQLRSAPGAVDGPFLDLRTDVTTVHGSYLYIDEGQLWGFISEADIETLPAAADPLDDKVFRHDVVLANTAGDIFNAAAGSFTVQPVVTTDLPVIPVAPSVVGDLDFSVSANSGLGLVLGLF